ncbi:MAG: hypothetical protein KIT22_19830, partial [Verrucomicrobiae bacterium]|nr:hypothetical protein [Verrucomicrobiae bacterium]
GGGFRGVVANVLWIRADQLQQKEKFFELYTLSDWITKLQPEFSQVWVMQAWNMAWNISAKYTEPADRWLWVRSGVEMLRDEGLRYNPRDPLLYRELAWIFQDKIGKYTDLAHQHYKQQWILEMHAALGTNTVPDELLNPETDGARRRAAILRDTYKLDPAFMREVDDKYGPLDWRMPEAHALYWAALGLRRCKGSAFDMLFLRRALWQTMQSAFIRGRLIQHHGTNRVDFGPNLEMISKVNQTYEEMKTAEPEKSDVVIRAQKNFLRSAIYNLYTNNRMRDAAVWFHYARTNFSDVVGPDQGLDEFVVAGVTETIQSAKPTQIRALLDGLVHRYLQAQFYGEDDDANGHALLARRVWEFYDEKYKNAPNVRIASLPEIEADARARLFPAAASRSAATNSPALQP